MDVGMGNTTDLYIYEQNESSKPTILLESKHSFEITGGDDAHCHMAVFGDFVYLGTSVSSQYAQMNYKTLTTLTTMMCSSSTNTSSITASDKTVVVSQQGPSGPGCMAAFNERERTNAVVWWRVRGYVCDLQQCSSPPVRVVVVPVLLGVFTMFFSEIRVL